MAKEQKIHYAGYELATESDPQEYWTESPCNTYAENPELSDNISEVTCKKCLKIINKIV